MGKTVEDSAPATVNDKNDGKSVKKSSKGYVAPVSAQDDRWVTFVDGNGMWSQGQSVNNLPGYNTYAGGVQIGASYQGIKNFSFGPYVGYQGTRVNYTGGNSGGSTATDNSVRYGLFGEYTRGGLYLDGIVGGAYNSVSVDHNISIQRYGTSWNSSANGNVSGGEFDSLLGGGYEFKTGALVFGPMSSLQYTYINLGGTQESNSGVIKESVGSQSTSSLLYTLGGQAHYDLKVTSSKTLQPFASLAWQHEFLQNSYNLASSIGGYSFNYQTTNPGRDQYIAAIGGNLLLTKSLSAYAVCNLVNGDQRVFSQAVSGGVNFKF
jgi:outer membrane autotransporter protein